MNTLKPTLTTAPATALISIEEARAHVRRDDSDDDAVLTSLIAVVMSHLDGVDGVLTRCLVRQEWAESMDDFPAGDVLPLTLSPAVSVTSIEYYDDQNALRTFASSNYTIHNGRAGAYVKLEKESSWPSTYDRDDAVTVTAIYGYGDAAANVPAVIKHAALLLLGHWYENREAVVVGTSAVELPAGVMKLLRPFIKPRF